jgi:hypothetical protein
MTTWLFVFDYVEPDFVASSAIEVILTTLEINMKRLKMSHAHPVVPTQNQALINKFLGYYKKTKNCTYDIVDSPMNLEKCIKNSRDKRYFISVSKYQDT